MPVGVPVETTSGETQVAATPEIVKKCPAGSPRVSDDSPNTGAAVVVALVAAALFMENLDVTIMTTALPQMAHSFNVHPADLGIGVTAYLLAVAVFIPLSGWAADRFGVRTLFTSALVVFTAASAVCGMTDGLASFTVARIVQGIGGAMMVPVGRLAVLRATRKEDLMRAINLITWPGLIAPVIGPPLGGFIATYASWRWIFYLNLPLGLAGVLLSLRFVTNEREGATRSFDMRGFLLCGIACTTLLYATELVARHVAQWREVFVFVFVSGVAGVSGLIHLRRADNPVVDLSALRIKTFAVALIGGALFRMSMSGLLILLPLMFQVGFGLSAFESGLLTLAVFAGNLSMKLVTAPMMKRFGFRTVLLVNGAVNAVALSAMCLLDAQTPYSCICAVLFVSGLSRSLQFTAFNSHSFADVPKAQMTAASTLSSALQPMTIGMGVALGSIVLRVAEQLYARDGHAIASSNFTLALAAIAALSLLAIFMVFSLDHDAGAQVSGHVRRSAASFQ